MGVIRGIKSFIPLQCSVASAADWSPSLVQALQTPVSLQTLPRSFVPTEPRALEKPEKSCTPTGFAALLGEPQPCPSRPGIWPAGHSGKSWAGCFVQLLSKELIGAESLYKWHTAYVCLSFFSCYLIAWFQPTRHSTLRHLPGAPLCATRRNYREPCARQGREREFKAAGKPVSSSCSELVPAGWQTEPSS